MGKVTGVPGTNTDGVSMGSACREQIISMQSIGVLFYVFDKGIDHLAVPKRE